MSFRGKVALSTAAAVGLAVWAVALVVSALITDSFKQRDAERGRQFVEQARREFDSRGRELARRVEAIAASTEIARIAAALAEPAPDTSSFLNDAAVAAQEQSLDFLSVAGPDGAIITSAQWPARFGYREGWLPQTAEWPRAEVFFRREDLPDSTAALGLFVVRTVRVPSGQMYIVGGQRLTQAFLDSLALPPGMKLGVWDAASKAPVEVEALLSRMPAETTITSGEETLTAFPLRARDGAMLGALVARNSRADLLSLISYTWGVALAVGLVAVVLGAALSWWIARRVTRPVGELARNVREVAGGNWTVRAEVDSADEIGRLAADFNVMTTQLVEQRERMVQAERVAAWRELARRLAHELKNPLFPLQITVENLQRARAAVSAAEFEEIFEESTSTLLAELQNLKTIIGRFSDFAKMPTPQLEPVDVNALVQETARFFDPQFGSSIRAVIETDPQLPAIRADGEQLRRALRNLVLNAMDAMPDGGIITLRTRPHGGAVTIEVADTGQGLTREECDRLFTPYYTTKQHGTGLGLAIVQSVVSDHHGSIHVDSEPGRGTTFRIELPAGC